MSRKRTFFLTVSLLIASLVSAQELSVVLEVGSVARASTPRPIGDRILFTYEFGPDRHDGRIHSVEIAFAHDEFSTLHAYRRNENDIYVLLYEPPPDATELRYRLVVNGIWTTDPSSPDSVTDRWGVRLSRTTIPAVERMPTGAPVVHADGTVEFFVTAPEGSRVTVAGSFNGWDPFMTSLHEVAPGRFSRRLRLGSGEHLYYYVVDGLRLPDPGNDQRKYHRTGMAVSVVSLP